MSTEIVFNGLTKTELEKFLCAGFKKTKYAGQNGDFLTKHMQCSDLASVMNAVVDSENVFAEDGCTVEVGPDGCIQFCTTGDYYEHENYDRVLETDSWEKLAADAGVTLNSNEPAAVN